jgi:junctophilin
VLITSQKKKHLFLIRSAKFRERIDAAVDSAQRASKYALQKADIAISRTATARGKAELADVSADHAKVDSEVAIQTAREFAPDFKPSLLERFERIRARERFRNTLNDEPPGVNKLKPHENQLSPNQMAQSSNISSPNKMSQNQQPMQQQTQAPQQNLLNPQPTIRRTSVNPMMRQSSIDYNSHNSTMYGNASSNQVDYSSTLGHNQQFAQPQPPGNSAFNTPQKQQQQSYNQQAQQSAQQPQHNQLYQNNASQYQQQPMNSHLQQSENLNSYSSYQQSGQNYSDQQASNYVEAPPRRNSRQVSDSGRPMLGSIHQNSIDHFDHYKRPPSRDSSVDRYSRAASRLGGGSRQPSVDRQGMSPAPQMINPDTLIDRSVRAGSQMRGTTPAPNLNGSVMTGVIGGGSGAASRRGSRSGTPVFQQQPSIQTIQAQYSSPNQPFEDVLLRQRTLGQDIIPSPGQPKRTESLFVPNKPAPSGGGGGGGSKGMSKVCVNYHKECFFR